MIQHHSAKIMLKKAWNESLHTYYLIPYSPLNESTIKKSVSWTYILWSNLEGNDSCETVAAAAHRQTGMFKVLPHSFLLLQLPADTSHGRMWPRPCGAHRAHKATACCVYSAFQEEKEAFLFFVAPHPHPIYISLSRGQRWCQIVTFNIKMGRQMFFYLRSLLSAAGNENTAQKQMNTHVHDNKKGLQLQPRPTAIL